MIYGSGNETKNSGTKASKTPFYSDLSPDNCSGLVAFLKFVASVSR